MTSILSKELKLLSNEEIFDMYLECKDDKYLTCIIEKNRNSIFSIAIKFKESLPKNKKNFFEVDDFYHEGVIGYMEGLKKYDKTRNAKVNSACYFWAYYYISKHFHKYSKIITYPDMIRKVSKKVSVDELDDCDELLARYKKLIIEHNRPTENVDELFDFKYNISDENGYVVEDRFIPFILSHFNSDETLIINKQLAKSGKAPKTKIVQRVINSYQEIKNQLLFTMPLIRKGEYVMSRYSYDMWHIGSFSTKDDTFKNIDIYNIEKKHLGFIELLLPNGDVLLKTI